MLKAYKYRLNPTKEQVAMIEQTIGCCRLVYNVALQVKIEAYKANGTKLTAYDLCYQLAEMKQDYKWMREVDSQALQASVKKLDVAFRNFYRGSGYPKYKSKHGKQSFQCPTSVRRIDWINSTLTIPKIKMIPIVLSRRFDGEIKTVTITKTTTGKYFASILVDNKILLPIKKPISINTSIGVDLGIKHFAVLSDGSEVDNPRYLKSNLSRLKCLQRRASRKKKGSANRKKANKKIAIVNERVANMRKDFLHKFSDAITKQYDTVCVEDLNVKGMIGNHNLAQSITDVGWALAVQFLKYKTDFRGKNFIQIGRFVASSKIHNKCGFKNEVLLLSNREWLCPICKEIVSRDQNAALNILDEGLKLLTSVGSRKEPVELPSKDGAKKQEVIDN